MLAFKSGILKTSAIKRGINDWTQVNTYIYLIRVFNSQFCAQNIDRRLSIRNFSKNRYHLLCDIFYF